MTMLSATCGASAGSTDRMASWMAKENACGQSAASSVSFRTIGYNAGHTART